MDIKEIFDWYNIPYITFGKNVQHGNFNIRCPFCGYDDPSEHLGISLTTGYWACWRNQDHRGKKPHKLLMKVLGLSYGEVEGLVTTVDRTKLLEPEIEEKSNTTRLQALEFPWTIRSMAELKVGHRFRSYLERRGFREVGQLIDDYDIHYSMASGPWKDRIVIPIYIDQRLVTWTARSIHPTAEIRYRTLSKEKSVLPIKDILWNYDEIWGNATAEDLVLVEGPFDALKLDFYGKELGLRATCMFGSSISDNQIDLLSTLIYRNLYILLDSGTYSKALGVQKRLAFLRPRIIQLPEGVADPGNLTYEQIKTLRGTLDEV